MLGIHTYVLSGGGFTVNTCKHVSLAPPIHMAGPSSDEIQQFLFIKL